MFSCSSESDGEKVAVPDTESPTTPSGLKADNITQNSLYLYWDSALDNVKVKNYSLYQNNEFLVGSGKPSYFLENLVPGTEYTYQVMATDAAGNSSELSNPLNVATMDPLEAELQYDSGNLEDYLGNLLDMVPGISANKYKVPTETDLKQWDLIIDAILDEDITEAVHQAVYLNYQIVEFTDTYATPNQVYFVLKEYDVRLNYWGTYVFSKTPKRKDLVLGAPHVLHDQKTGYQAAFAFRRNVAKALFLSGAHRCDRDESSSCDGTTRSCSTNYAPYRISDVPHNVNSMFQKTTENLYNSLPNSVFVQLHGFGKEPTDPYVIMSNGTNKTPVKDYVVMIKDALLEEDNTLTFKIPHINTNWTRYAAMDNTQGRYINGSSDPCSVPATYTTGRFVHIEQERSKLRENETGWLKVSNALGKVF
ncbi:fibronectin type III domain-containing protein [Allomuricauda sp. F6463D]|uniref:fibronectin type III domain-containing protein n=1 Tax=Allomuricauda sp. F6463D TaxID=2926409 RepID=UPI001FF2F1AE|nr:fibronectin type III domain-containing protein [Muricauda sp. F6463D]